MLRGLASGKEVPCIHATGPASPPQPTHLRMPLPSEKRPPPSTTAHSIPSPLHLLPLTYTFKMSKDQPLVASTGVSTQPSLISQDGAGESARKSAGITPKEITDRLNPSTSLRLLLILSFPLVMLIGAPYWWYTTSITRLPLPVERIAALENAPVRQGLRYPIIPCH